MAVCVYMREDTTDFCYRWDADGNCAIDTKQVFP